MTTRAVNVTKQDQRVTLSTGESLQRGLVARSLPRLAVLAGRLVLVVVIATAVAAGSLAYRIWAQASSSLPQNSPGTWIYDLAGRLAAPFERFETAPPAHEAPAVNLPAIIALDFYLVVACALLFITWLTRTIVNFKLHPAASQRAAVTPRTLPLKQALGRAYRRAGAAAGEAVPASAVIVSSAWRSADAGLEAFATYLIASVRDLDWEAYRARAQDGLDRLRSFRISESERLREGARRGADLLQEARRCGAFAADTWRLQLAGGPRSITWLSERAITSAGAGHRSLSAYRARRVRWRYIPGSQGRRMSRRSFLHLPAPRP